MTTKTPKKNKKIISRVRFNPEAIETKNKAIDENERRVQAHLLFVKEQEEREKSRLDFCIEHRSVSINRYMALFHLRFGCYPFKPFMKNRMFTAKAGGKKVKVFDSVTMFLKEERELNGGDNKLFDMYNDYYTVVLDYYLQYNRRPTMNQIGPGPVNKDQFRSWTYHEHNANGGYWITKEQLERSESMAKTASGFKDIFIDKMRIENNLEPIFGTTQEDIDNWDGKSI